MLYFTTEEINAGISRLNRFANDHRSRCLAQFEHICGFSPLPRIDAHHRICLECRIETASFGETDEQRNPDFYAF